MGYRITDSELSQLTQLLNQSLIYMEAQAMISSISKSDEVLENIANIEALYASDNLLGDFKSGEKRKSDWNSFLNSYIEDAKNNQLEPHKSGFLLLLTEDADIVDKLKNGDYSSDQFTGLFNQRIYKMLDNPVSFFTEVKNNKKFIQNVDFKMMTIAGKVREKYNQVKPVPKSE